MLQVVKKTENIEKDTERKKERERRKEALRKVEALLSDLQRKNEKAKKISQSVSAQLASPGYVKLRLQDIDDTILSDAYDTLTQNPNLLGNNIHRFGDQ
eukprot:469264-Rhodomonas_salina.1